MTYQIRVKSKQNTKATVASGVIMARTLQELLDVDVSGVSDKYVIMYDATTQKYTAVNPDEVLSLYNFASISFCSCSFVFFIGFPSGPNTTAPTTALGKYPP